MSKNIKRVKNEVGYKNKEEYKNGPHESETVCFR